MARANVDLPAPDGPITPTALPGLMSKLTARSDACCCPGGITVTLFLQQRGELATFYRAMRDQGASGVEAIEHSTGMRVAKVEATLRAFVLAPGIDQPSPQEQNEHQQP